MGALEKPESGAKAAAFQALVEKHSDLVYNVAYRIMGNPQDAEDVAQDALLSAYRAFDSFRGESQVTTWLYRITTNAALMRLRKRRRGAQLTETGIEDVELPSKGLLPEDEAARAELAEKVKAAIALLPPDFRTAVVLRDVEGLDNNEAAEALGISVPNLKSRLHRGRLMLRKYLADYLRQPAR